MTQTKIGNQWIYQKDSEALHCPVCNEQVEYLYGEDTNDGGVKGCEICWRQPQNPRPQDVPSTNEIGDISSF